MFQRILVPLDGSLLAERALPLATQIARVNQGMLVLLHVGSVVGEQGPDTLPQSALGEALMHIRMKRAQEYLAALASSQVFRGIALTTAVLSGPVVATTQTALCTYQADLLVLCEQIDPQERASGIGGVARQVLEHSNTPVLLIREHGPSLLTSRADREQPITVLAAFAGPHPAHALIEQAASLLTALDGKHQGHLRFVPLHASGTQSETPAFSTQIAEQPGSLVGSEASRTNTSAVFLQNHREIVQQEKAHWRDEDVILVLGIPMKPRRSAWILEDTQQYVLSRRTMPILFVPLFERG